MTRRHIQRQPCKVCGKPTQSILALCPAHQRGCAMCGVTMTARTSNQKYCPPCRLEATRNRNRIRMRLGIRLCRDCDGPNDSGTSQQRCIACAAKRRELAPLRQARPADKQTVVRVRTEIPCVGCRHGMPSNVAWSGWECRLGQVVRCEPLGPARLREER